MRKLIYFIFIALAIIGWGLFIYQNRLQKESEERMARRVLEELEYSQKIKDSIRAEVERRQKEQELVSSLENQRNLIESLRQEIQQSEEKNFARSLALEEALVEKISDYQLQQEALIAQLKEDYLKQIEETTHKIFSLEEKMKEVEKESALIQEKLIQIERQLQEYKNKQEDCLQRIVDLNIQSIQKESQTSAPTAKEAEK